MLVHIKSQKWVILTSYVFGFWKGKGQSSFVLGKLVTLSEV